MGLGRFSARGDLAALARELDLTIPYFASPSALTAARFPSVRGSADPEA